MYEGLVNQLRNVSQEIECFDCPFHHDCRELQKTCVFIQAVDAIEELNKPKWIKFTKRPLEPDEQEEHPEWCYILDCETPYDMQEILVSNGKFVWTDTFCVDGDECYLDGDTDLDELWWMPLPKPPEEET